MIKIFEMSYNRNFCKKRVSSYSSEINEHIIECVVYAEDKYHRKHWIDELSAWFDIVNSTKMDKNKKFSAQEYLNFVFEEFGTTKVDAETNIKVYKFNNRKRIKNEKSAYPDFEITNEMVSNLFKMYRLILEKYCDIFADKNNKLTVNDFKNELSKDFESVIG